MTKPVSLPTTVAALGAAVNDIATYSNYFVDSGAANAMVVTLTTGLTFSYAAGVGLQVQVAATNTSATTINVNALGTKNVTNSNLTALSAGQLIAGAIVLLIYDGTEFQLTGLVFPQTAGEVANSIVPTNTTFQPGDIRRYGAKPDNGTTNNQTAIQNALNANAGYYPVRVQGGGTGNYYGGLTTALTIPANTTIVGVDGSEVRWASTTPSSGPTWLGALSRPGLWLQGGNFKLTGPVTFSGPSVQVGSAGIPGKTIPGGMTPTGGVWQALETGLICVGTSITVPIQNVFIGPQVEFRWWGYDGIAFQYVENFQVTGAVIHDLAYHGVVALSCENGRVNDCEIYYIDPGNGNSNNCYGISFSANNSSGTTGGSSRSDANRVCLACSASGNYLHDIPRWAGIDSHGGFEITFGPGNVVYNCCNPIEIGNFPNGVGNTYGSENSSIIDNVCRIGQANGSATTVGQLGPGVKVGPLINGGAQGNALQPKISGNVVDGYGNLNSMSVPNGYPIECQDATGAVITNNILLNWTAFGIYTAGPNLGGVISDNYFGPVGTTYSDDACIYLNNYTNPPTVSGNVHNISSGTAAHYGLAIFSGLPVITVGLNDFSAATAAAYGNNLGQSAALSQFAGQSNPLVVGASLGTPTSALLKGTTAFSASATATVAFGVTLPSATYQVALSANANQTFWVTNKTTTGFKLNASVANSDSVDWLVLQ